MNLKQCIDNQDTKGKAVDASRSKTLSQGLELLKWLAARGSAMGVRELARETQMNVALVQRLVNSLCDTGFLEQDAETRKYRVGAVSFHVGQAFLAGIGLVERAAPILRDLSGRDALNSYLAVLSGDACLYLCVEQSPGALTVHALPGDRVPVHTTAIGKVLLASLPDAEVEALLGRVELERRTEKTKVRQSEIFQELEQIRAGGLAISDEENIPGIFALGAPIIDVSGRTVAAVSCACAAHLAAGERRHRVAAAVAAAAREISRRMGAPVSQPNGESV